MVQKCPSWSNKVGLKNIYTNGLDCFKLVVRFKQGLYGPAGLDFSQNDPKSPELTKKNVFFLVCRDGYHTLKNGNFCPSL